MLHLFCLSFVFAGCPLTWDQWQSSLTGPLDVNGNGLLDVQDLVDCLFAGLPPQPISFVSQNLDASFVHGQNLRIADLDQDLDLDVIVAYSLSDQVVAYINGGDSLGGGDGSIWATIEVAAPNTIVATDVTIADFDGQDGPDIAAVGLFDRSGGFTSAGEVAWYKNPGDVFATWDADHFTGLTFWGAIHVRAADLTGEGRADLVVSAIELTDIGGTPQASGIWWFRNEGGTPLTWSARMVVDDTLNTVNNVWTDDIDNDGDLDLVGAGWGSDQVAWYENTRIGVDPSPVFMKHILANVSAPHYVIATQLDADATLEVIVGYEHANGDGALAWFDAPANPDNLWTLMAIDNSFGVGEVHFCAADFDFNLENDLAVVSYDLSDGRFYMRDAMTWGPALLLQSPPSGINHIACGDVTGDGRWDLVTTTYGNGATDLVDIWVNTPDP